MYCSVITSDKLKSIAWSGGVTTQLFIFPPCAVYKEKNFKFRLSTATVESVKSDFTSLPGVTRKLMLLSGNIVINHWNHHSKQLSKFDQDVFDGGWKTTAEGRCVDFNLMMTAETTGELYSLAISKGRTDCHNLKFSDWFFVYVYTGNIIAKIEDDQIHLGVGDFLVIRRPVQSTVEIVANEDSQLVLAEIYHLR